MKNEFGYIDKKPFKIIYGDYQTFSIITIDNGTIEFKFRESGKFSNLNLESIYAVDNKFNAITAFDINTINTWFTGISTNTVKFNKYFIESNRLNNNDKINHFTMKTKIRELIYYNNSIGNIFINNSIKTEYKFKKDRLDYIKVNAKRLKEEKIGEILIAGENKVKIFLKKEYMYSQNHSKKEKNFKENIYFILRFQKGVLFNEVYKLIKLLDSVVYLMTFLKRRYESIFIKNFKGNTYSFIDKKIQFEKKEIINNSFLICEILESKEAFIKLFNNIYSIYEESKNALFPFLEYDIKQSSVEIDFLEHFKVLEYIKAKENFKKGKGKNPTFLLEILKENKLLKEEYFGNQEESEIEEEIRSLRNHYSHEGYYIDDMKLPIPTDKPKRYKIVDYKWLDNVLKYIKISAYLELYKLCELTIDLEKIKSRLN